MTADDVRPAVPDLETIVSLSKRRGFVFPSSEIYGGINAVWDYGPLGVVPGALYGALRRRVPLLGAGRGLMYGMLLFVGNDEVMNTELGLAGPYSAYPAAAHLRGLVGHAVLGVATDTGLDILGA